MTEPPRQPLLRRVLLKTKPVPYVIWMAGLATITGSCATLIGWLMVRPGDVRLILFLMLFFVCLGCLMGLYVVRAMGLPFLATFGDVIGKGDEPKPQGQPTKSAR